MNGAIFKVFGVTILFFEIILAFLFAIAVLRTPLANRDLWEASVLFLGFLMLSTLIAVGLFLHHRWAAVTASLLGSIWSLVLAAILSFTPTEALVIGVPVVVGFLVPLYATIRGWDALKPVGNFELNSSSSVLRSSDRFHLE